MTTHDFRLNTRAYHALRRMVLDRDNGRCQIKGPTCRGVGTVVDHIIPRAEGGDVWDPRNLRAACVPCNGRGGAAIANARRKYRTGVAEYLTRF